MSGRAAEMAQLIADFRTGLFWAATSTLVAALVGSACLVPL